EPSREASQILQPESVAPSASAETIQSAGSSSPLRSGVTISGVYPAACSCGCQGTQPPQLVFALGQLGFDFGTEARRDSIQQHIGANANPFDPRQLLEYLTSNHWDASAIIWTLNLDATPI